MPPLPGFNANSFTTYDDLKLSVITLLRSLQPYHSPSGARIKLPLFTGTHFDDTAAQLEGYARPLWALASLLHSGDLTEKEHPDLFSDLVKPYVRGLANGTDPTHEEYWGEVLVRDQRMVEMEIIAFALLAAPSIFWQSQTNAAKVNIKKWLYACNGKDFPRTNWLWFRVLTNLALTKVCGVPYEDVHGFMEEDLQVLDGFDIGEGWSADGEWGPGGRQADYYSGSFAIQVSRLIYARFAEGLGDDVRCKKFVEDAREFAGTFWRYFDENGAAIPFGRSLTYRFAFAGFWSAIAFAEIELTAPLNDWGVIKGLLLRHFRWWSTKPDIFNIDGTLTIGFTYPNMYMSEDYNSPQSPYWATKSFLALGLPASHRFWAAEEKSLPKEVQERGIVTKMVKPAAQIMCDTGNHHFLLSTGQFCPWPLKATEAKYGKYAYSSHFGFSVPTGPILMQLAADSTLALSKDGGETWRVPWKVSDYQFREVFLVNGKRATEVPALCSVWRPWRDVEVEVETTILAPSERWKDWYVTVHRIVNKGSSTVELEGEQGGFAIQGRSERRGEVLPDCSDISAMSVDPSKRFMEGKLVEGDGTLICSNAGASGIMNLTTKPPTKFSISPEAFKPDANTNLMWQRTLIPTIRWHVAKIAPGEEVSLANAVFAAARREGMEDKYDGIDIAAKWKDVPVVCSKTENSSTNEFISVPWA